MTTAFKRLQRSPQEIEEGANAFPASAFPYPEDFLAVGLHDDSGIAVPLVQCKLIHPDYLDVGEINGANPFVESPFIYFLHLVPGQPQVCCHVLYREDIAQSGHTCRQSRGYPRILSQP